MKTREVAVVAVVVMLGVAGAALPTVAATTADAAVQADETNATATETNATANESGNESAAFGAQMTAFMQSSASETNDTVESGMWKASFERANESEQARLAHDRTTKLEERLERLRERNRTLTERYENGSISRSEYVAQASKLSGRIAALRTSINDTDRAATKAGVNESRLDRLRNDARNMSGPETAGVARDVVAGGQGPPAERGPGTDVGPDNETTNRSVGNDDGSGPSDSDEGAGESGGADGGENANPSDGGVGTGSSGNDSGETSSADDDGSTDGSGDAGGDTGASSGNEDGVAGGDEVDESDGSGSDTDGSGEDGSQGNDPSEGGTGGSNPGGNGPNDYLVLFGILP